MRKLHYTFTIIELLMVISIIVILAALLMPALRSARAQARKIDCAGNLKQIGAALYMYLDDYNGCITRGSSNSADNYASMLAPYLNVVKKSGIAWNMSGKVYICNSIPPEYTYSYAQNAWSGYTDSSKKYRNISDFTNPARIFFLCDGANQILFNDSYIDYFEPRHVGTGNCVFMDGHTGSKKVLSPSDMK